MVFSEAASDASYHFRERSLLSRGTSKSIRFTHRSVRETEGAEGRREAAKDFSSGARRRHAHTERTASGEASGRGGTTRNQKISSPAFETTIARRVGRRRLKVRPGDSPVWRSWRCRRKSPPHLPPAGAIRYRPARCSQPAARNVPGP